MEKFIKSLRTGVCVLLLANSFCLTVADSVDLKRDTCTDNLQKSKSPTKNVGPAYLPHCCSFGRYMAVT